LVYFERGYTGLVETALNRLDVEYFPVYSLGELEENH
jgi:hypothetical protein